MDGVKPGFSMFCIIVRILISGETATKAEGLTCLVAILSAVLAVSILFLIAKMQRDRRPRPEPSVPQPGAPPKLSGHRDA